MRGVIVLPQFFIGRHTDNYKFLFRRIRDDLGFHIKYTDWPVLTGYDVVIAYAVPHHNFLDYPVYRFVDLPSNVRLIVYTREVQCYGNERCREHRAAMFERADLILSPVKEHFLQLFPHLQPKFRYFPFFFATDKRYSFGMNPAPRRRVLLSGAINPVVYPLRASIADAGHPLIDYRHSRFAIGDDYAQLLYQYLALITDCSVFGMVVAKIFEAMAAGTLVLVKPCADMEAVGLRKFEHYFPITDNSWKDVVENIVLPRNDDIVAAMRRRARRFVRANHGLEARFQTLRRYIMEL